MFFIMQWITTMVNASAQSGALEEKSWSRPEWTRVAPLRDGEGNANEIKKGREDKFLHSFRSLIHVIFRVEYKDILNAAMRQVQAGSGSPQENDFFSKSSQRGGGGLPCWFILLPCVFQMCYSEEGNFEAHDLVYCKHKEEHDYAVRAALGFGRAKHNLKVLWSENTTPVTHTEFLFVSGSYSIWNPEC